MKIRPATTGHALRIMCAGDCLRAARHHSKEAGCPQLTKKINLALKSWDGARRHVRHRINRTPL